MTNRLTIDRRALITAGALGAAALSTPTSADTGLRDFSFQDGRWSVRHRTLRKRLAGNDEWIEFGGTCTCGPLMGGMAGYEDNFLDRPTGAYRAAGLRRFDHHTGLWSIWWWDERFSEIEPPVMGKFENGAGTFFGDSLLDGKRIKVRFIWDMLMPGIPRWQQAFSLDDGTTWETNWYMEFRR